MIRANVPIRPRLTKTGCYDPKQLGDFMDQCARENIPKHMVARTLQVTPDRIEFFMNNRNLFKAREKIYQ